MRTLAALLPCGVLLLGADARPQLASEHACTLLGVGDEGQLRARWDTLAPALGFAEPAALATGAHPLRVSRDARVADATRALRLEVHCAGAGRDAHYLVLLQQRDRAAGADTVLIGASRAQALQHVLAGMLHDLNAPLNNLTLTLALLDGALARMPADDAPLERCRRYAATLEHETRRLSDSARAMRAAVTPEETASGDAPIAALLHDAQHALRQHATLHEVRVSIGAAAADLRAAGDIGLLRLALLDLLLTAIGVTAPGGDIVVTPRRERDDLRVDISARAAHVPAAALRTLDGILSLPDLDWLGFVAARRILEMQGGAATLHEAASDTILMEARLPLRRA